MQSFVCRPLWMELYQNMCCHKRTDSVHRLSQFLIIIFLGYLSVEASPLMSDYLSEGTFVLLT